MSYIKFDYTVKLFICPENKSEQTFENWLSRFSEIASDGSTVYKVLGQWPENGTLLTEEVRIMEVWTCNKYQVIRLLCLLDTLRKVENQQAVSVVINGTPFIFFDTDGCAEIASQIGSL